MKAEKEDNKMKNGGYSKDSPDEKDEKIPQSPELTDLPEAPEMPSLPQPVEINVLNPSPSAPYPSPPSPPRSRASSASSAAEHELKTMKQEKNRNAAESSDSESDKDDKNVLAVSKGPNSVSSGSPRSTPSPQGSGKWTGREGGLDLPMTAREMRERIASMKKKDKRVEERMDFKKKYEIIKTL
ncbi:mediator of RNA polymerase II transcription subunit 15 [Eurytemora carolleeae]|uniref:mediator of RNA polymerase II transcription subunit 15 n=1 Tax=Eurytemora carolleeae TaxID=1294199 RepID=UPI000C77A45C|nr:mediator of RNA polymerase II transcription subunit 15 [Eurytemora carolleeae]|eukprot:XP_023338949.1 mediator of RNA polymerase II transcription subunit 15-like [Eurytemora affinis]